MTQAMFEGSVNELQGLLSKAARGAGAPAAQAARFGQAGVYHLAQGGDEGDLDAALSERDLDCILDIPVLIQGVAMEGEGINLRLKPPIHPLANAYCAALPQAATVMQDGSISIDPDTLQRPPLPARLTVSMRSVTLWQALGAKTFVPETEQSRLAGAGAGLTDND
jgi:hypothetical protein